MDPFATLPEDFESLLSPTTQTFRLFDLPDELWLHILTLSVTRSHPIDPTWARTNHQQALIAAQPPITRTCRLLRKEGLLLFYRLNTFELQHVSYVACARNWLIAIGGENRKVMGRLNFHCEVEPEFWVRHAKLCGFEVEVVEAEAGGEVATMRMRREKIWSNWRAKTFVVTFL